MMSEKKRKYIEIENEMIYTIGNEIYFTEDVNTESIEHLKKEIIKLVESKIKKSTKDSKLNVVYIVDTHGGCVSSVLKFVDFLNLIRKKYKDITFTSIINGTVASAGTIMCAVADNRYMTKHATAMIHELSSGNRGHFTHLVSYTEHLKKEHLKLVDIYKDNSKMSRDEIEELLKNETWFTAEEYLKKGLIDEIK